MKVLARSFVLVLAVVSASVASGQAVELSNTAVNPFGYVRVPDDPALEPQTLTLEAWIRPLGPGIGGTHDAIGATFVGKIWENMSGSWLGSWSMNWRASDGRIFAGVVHSVGVSGTAGTSQAVVGLGTSHHVAMTFDGTLVRLLVDGKIDLELPALASNIDYGAHG